MLRLSCERGTENKTFCGTCLELLLFMLLFLLLHLLLFWISTARTSHVTGRCWPARKLADTGAGTALSLQGRDKAEPR